MLWLVVKMDDSPMQVETIDGPTVTHLTLKNLDRHSHYRFYLRGRTAAGDGESIKKEGATTLDGGSVYNYRGDQGSNKCLKSLRTLEFYCKYNLSLA